MQFRLVLVLKDLKQSSLYVINIDKQAFHDKPTKCGQAIYRLRSTLMNYYCITGYHICISSHKRKIYFCQICHNSFTLQEWLENSPFSCHFSQLCDLTKLTDPLSPATQQYQRRIGTRWQRGSRICLIFLARYCRKLFMSYSLQVCSHTFPIVTSVNVKYILTETWNSSQNWTRAINKTFPSV